MQSRTPRKSKIASRPRARRPRGTPIGSAESKATRPVLSVVTAEKRRRRGGTVTISNRPGSRQQLSTTPWDPTATSSGQRTRRVLPSDDKTTEREVNTGIAKAGRDEVRQAERASESE